MSLSLEDILISILRPLFLPLSASKNIFALSAGVRDGFRFSLHNIALYRISA